MLTLRTYGSVVRVIVTGAVLLVSVACGSGAGVQTQSVEGTSTALATQSAGGTSTAVMTQSVGGTSTAVATRPATVSQEAIGVSLPRRRVVVASFNQVICPSSAGCVASFSEGGRLLVLGERGGKWTREAAPDVEVLSLACHSLGSCVGSGISPYGKQPAEVMTQSGRSWHAFVVQLPGNTSPSSSPLRSVSCGSAGDCTAVGSYQVFKPGRIESHALTVEQKNGTWGAGFDAQLPPDAATTSDVNGTGPGGVADVVSCPSAGNCAVGGTYAVLVGDLNESAGWVATEQAGKWEPAVSVRLPGGGTAVDHFGFTGLSCPSAGNCTAVGGSTDPKGGEQGLILEERNGVWLQGIRAPLPRGGAAPSEPNAFDDPLLSVSCAAPDDCAAVGAYVMRGSPNRYHGWLLTERAGTWSASGLVLPPKTKASGGVFLKQVSCPSRGNCVAVGYYAGKGITHGLIVIERRGKWQRAIKPTLPADAGKRQHGGLDGVSCSSTSRCTVVGSYNDSSGKSRGLILSLRIP
jgi:hypothetical protein